VAAEAILPAVALQPVPIPVDTIGVDTSHISSAASQSARREIDMVSRLLKSGEQVIDVCHGTGGGRPAVVVVTDRRVVYLQRRRFWGAQVESVPLARVRSVEERVGVRHATVAIDAGGRVFELADVDRALAQIFCARVRARLTRG
jgi:hypothetical protein